MRLDNAARLERLLQRHPSVVVADHDPARSFMYRRDEVLVSAQDANRVDDQARRWLDVREDFTDLSVARLRLRSSAQVDLADFVRGLTQEPHRALEVAPNHLLRGEPHYGGGPFDTPMPMPARQGPPSAPSGRVTVAVLDTGIDPHPWYSGSDWYDERRTDLREVLDGDLDWDLDTEAGHGTFIAGVVVAQAPTAYLSIERVLSSDGICDELELIQGLDRVRRNVAAAGRRVDVLNLSLGGYTFDDRPSPVLTQALARFGRRTVIVAAAGNNGSDRPFWPAALKNCIAVGSLNTAGTARSSFSNYGWWVDACAVGEGVYSSFVSFSEQSGDPADRDYFGYAAWSGTSFAAPKVTGAIAGLAASKTDMPVTEAADIVLDQDANRTVPDLGILVDDEALGLAQTSPR